MLPKDYKPFLLPGETLVCFGDSLTQAKEGYVSFLQKELEKRSIKVINAGLGGDKTPAALARLQKDVIDLAPDAVSLFFGTNDAVIGRGIWRDEPTVDPVTYEDNLCWIIHLCRLRCKKIRNFSINTILSRWEGTAYADFGACNTPYCQAARRAADRMNVRLVPLDVTFDHLWAKNAAKASPEGYLYTADGRHMTGEGYEIIAQTMLKEWNLL